MVVCWVVPTIIAAVIALPAGLTLQDVLVRHLAATATGITALVLPSGFVHVLSAAGLALLVLAGLGIAAACALGPPPGPPHPRRPPPCTPNDCLQP